MFTCRRAPRKAAYWAMLGAGMVVACGGEDVSGDDNPLGATGGATSSATGGSSLHATGGLIGTSGQNTTGGSRSTSATSTRSIVTGSGGRATTVSSVSTGGSVLGFGGFFATGSSRGFGGFFGRGGSLGVGGSVGTGGANANTSTDGSVGSTNAGVTPLIPAVNGTCPTFGTGTATIGGLSGISLQVGAKKEGTGSLIFYWHGTGMSASEVNTMIPSAVRQEILSQGGIIVSFQSSLGSGGDCSGTSTFSKDDFNIADLIAACAVRDHGIDPRRIYTTGCSAGGLQAGCMGALRSNYIAAVVPNSGGLVTSQAIEDKTRIPSVMTMHGGTSDQVIVSFSQTSATYDELMDAAGGFVVNCNHGGGHCGAPAALYTAGWEFMRAHPFGVKPEPYASGLPSSFPTYCTIY